MSELGTVNDNNRRSRIRERLHSTKYTVASVADKIRHKRQVAKSYHDRKAQELPELEIGQEVCVAPYQNHPTWEAGICVDKLSDRSYLLESNGQLIRRNREDVKPKALNSTPESLPATTPPVDDLTVTTPAKPVLRRSQRTSKPPAKFTDFVMP